MPSEGDSLKPEPEDLLDERAAGGSCAKDERSPSVRRRTRCKSAAPEKSGLKSDPSVSSFLMSGRCKSAPSASTNVEEGPDETAARGGRSPSAQSVRRRRAWNKTPAADMRPVEDARGRATEADTREVVPQSSVVEDQHVVADDAELGSVERAEKRLKTADASVQGEAIRVPWIADDDASRFFPPDGAAPLNERSAAEVGKTSRLHASDEGARAPPGNVVQPLPLYVRADASVSDGLRTLLVHHWRRCRRSARVSVALAPGHAEYLEEFLGLLSWSHAELLENSMALAARFTSSVDRSQAAINSEAYGSDHVPPSSPHKGYDCESEPPAAVQQPPLCIRGEALSDGLRSLLVHHWRRRRRNVQPVLSQSHAEYLEEFLGLLSWSHAELLENSLALAGRFASSAERFQAVAPIEAMRHCEETADDLWPEGQHAYT